MNDPELSKWILDNTKTHRVREDKIKYAVKGIFEKIKEYEILLKEKEYEETMRNYALLYKINKILKQNYIYTPRLYMGFKQEDIHFDFLNEESFVDNIDNRYFVETLEILNKHIEFLNKINFDNYDICKNATNILKDRKETILSNLIDWVGIKNDIPTVKFNKFKISVRKGGNIKQYHILIGIYFSLVCDNKQELEIHIDDDNFSLYYIDRNTENKWVKISSIEKYLKK